MNTVAQHPTQTQAVQTRQLSPIQQLAGRLSIDPAEAENIIKNTLMKAKKNQQVTNEELVTFLSIANEYRLNPLTKEIYAFNNSGGIQPIVSIDGWLKIINGHPEFDGMEYDDKLDANGRLAAVTCRIYRKDRSRPTEVTEYMNECWRDKSDPWAKWPARMLRHKATIQGARYAFGMSGIIDEDEAERYKSTNTDSQSMKDVTPPPGGLQDRLDGGNANDEKEGWSGPKEHTDQPFHPDDMAEHNGNNPFMDGKRPQAEETAPGQTQPPDVESHLEQLAWCQTDAELNAWEAEARKWPKGDSARIKLAQAFKAHKQKLASGEQ